MYIENIWCGFTVCDCVTLSAHKMKQLLRFNGAAQWTQIMQHTE